MNEISPREYGQLENKVKHLSEQMILMQADLRCIRNLLEQSKGGWRMMMLIGGAGASVAAGLAWLLSHWGLK
jgi:hypothetical protein